MVEMKDVPLVSGTGCTLWSRYEMKYLISESKAAAITNFVEQHLPLDRYCRARPMGEYPIVSLYLDSDNLQLCRESLAGLLKRFKLRVRSYSDDIDYPKFLEIKRRSNNVIVKSRAAVLRKDVATLLSGQHVPSLKNHEIETEALRQFQLYMKSVGARPKVLIRYMRRAYECFGENRVRVTFDRQLVYKVCYEPVVPMNGDGWQHNLIGMILEIKFTGRYPAWLERMVRYFNLSRQSMSKYVTSMKKACSLGFCTPKDQIFVD